MKGLLAALTIKLGVDSAEVKKGFDEATGKAKKWGTEVSSAAGSVAGKMALAGAAAATAFAVFARKSLDAQDNLGKFADRIGVSTAQLSRLQFAAERSGVANEMLNKGLQNLSKRTAETAAGLGENVRTFNELGLSAQKMMAMAPDQQFLVMADALKKVENESQRTMLAIKLFGDEGAALIQMTHDGSEGLRALGEESDRLGRTVTDVAAKNAAAANDALTNLSSAVGGSLDQVVARVAPTLTEFANMIADNIPTALDFIQVGFYALQRVANNVFDTLVAAAQSFGGVLYLGVAAPLAGVVDLVASALETLGVDGAESMRALSDSLAEGVQTGVEYAGAIANLGKKYEENEAVYISALDAMDAEKAARQAMLDQSKAQTIALEDIAGKNLSKAESDKIAADAAKAHADALKLQQQEFEQLKASAESIWQSVQTPLEQYAIKLKEIADLELAGALSAERATEIRARLAEQQMQQGDAFKGAQGALSGIGDMTGQADPMAAAEMEWEGKKAALVWMLEQEQITRAEFDALRIDAENQKESAISQIQMQEAARRAQFENMTAGQQTKHVLGQMVQMTAGVANHSKKMFALNKAAAIGNAIINTYQGVSMSLATYPMPLAAIMAAVHLAAGLAQVNAIKSQKFGGGTTPSMAGSVPTYNGTPVTAGNSQNTAGEGAGGGNSAVNVTVNIGKVDASEGITADNLASKIQSNVMRETVIGIVQDHVKNDGILIDPTSRQAVAIAGG